ncbi:protein-export membrane protein SecD [Candidatus Daviesbacteria bacterium RIFCSPHIGHO2_02_FULL_37_9]|nr:MAG: protein-export membrane protein SecD [Candidatus Daviesbacteria bacterium RIFCSPHIGHO2_02_FULL_37_9]
MRTKLWLIIILILAALFVDLPKVNLPNFQIPAVNKNSNEILGTIPLKLGLDLQGGTQLVLETKMENIASEDRDNALESARVVIERRVNLFGVSESVVQSSKVGDSRRILVDLPGIQNASEAASLVGKTAQLEFREIVEDPNIPATMSGLLISLDTTKPTGLTGADLKKSTVVFGQGGSQAGAQVSIEFTPVGAQKFAEITKRNIGKSLPIFLDELPVSAPTVQQEIIGGSAVITGNFTSETAEQLAVQLNAGALPVPIQIIEQRSIGATLGQESVNKSLAAGAIGLLTIMIYMAFYYGFLGIVADIALIIYSLLVLAIFKTGLFILPPVTLTLAGIAGFILSIGMAVDANILIFERMKEEKRWGKSNKTALEEGFKRAWSSIRDSNISSLITAAILYFLGTGPVRGFAITLAIGVLVSMFTAITITKTFLKLITK